jgi:hypothetical protein
MSREARRCCGAESSPTSRALRAGTRHRSPRRHRTWWAPEPATIHCRWQAPVQQLLTECAAEGLGLVRPVQVATHCSLVISLSIGAHHVSSQFLLCTSRCAALVVPGRGHARAYGSTCSCPADLRRDRVSMRLRIRLEASSSADLGASGQARADVLDALIERLRLAIGLGTKPSHKGIAVLPTAHHGRRIATVNRRSHLVSVVLC